MSRAARRSMVGALALTFALSGCTGSGGGSVVSGSPVTSGAGDGPCTLADHQRADLLALQLTAALQHRSRTQFLALATGASARAAMSSWFDNVDAIGFTTAAVGTVEGSPTGPEETAPATQRVTVHIGLHNAFDETLEPVLRTDKPQPDAPATDYALGTDVVHGAGGSCHLAITSWTSLSKAPWDTTHKLVVVRTRHVVVAGEASVAADVRRVAPLAETAASFLTGFFRSVKRSGDIRLRDYVPFVPTTNAQANSWFTYSKRPSGWTKDVGNALGVEYPLNGAQIPVSEPPGAPTVDGEVSEIGGGRVVVTRTGLRSSSSELTATLVHEFTHDLYNNYSGGWFTGKPTDAALAEGSARYVETFFRLDPTNTKVVHTLTQLGPVIRRHLDRFDGRTPTAGQIYGQASLANYYYDLSASCFSYLAAKYGVTFAFQSIRDAYANGGGPFSGVVTRIRGSEITFGTESTFQRAWARWLPGQV